ncbi:uncharacterized protein TNCV_3593621 [Trichonephila clavipes]|nr:uncharacterized protein TNCV_3593621 [Trichonephila clavipes]
MLFTIDFEQLIKDFIQRNIQLLNYLNPIIVGPDGTMVKPPTVFRGKNAIDQFLTKLLDEEKSILDILRFVKPMVFSMTDEENFKSSTLCSICENPLNGDAVRDHDHLTGAYRGAAHNRCNLNFKLANYIPVVIHNLRNYDGHFLIQGIGKFKEKRIQCIPENSEKFISFTLSSLRFIDSFQFLNTSLEKLAQNLKPCQFHLCNKYFASNAQFITRKGCYPYEYFDSFSKFYETQLPPQSAFFNSLTNENVSREDYEYAHHIWNIFQMHTLRDYHDLYVTVDVLLLSDIFENFRTLCQNYYKIDPCHTYTAPGLAWQACLKMTKVRLELLTDIDMHLFIEKGIRGGVAMISHRYAKANNAYLSNYDSSLPSSYIIYLDANNLYGWAMSQHLPTHDFSWTDEDVNFMNVPDDSEIGYIFEVDLEYPDELHDLHNCYPLAPEKIELYHPSFMEHSKKFVLLPEERLQNFVSEQLSELDEKMQSILRNKNMNDSEKVTLYLQILRKYVNFPFPKEINEDMQEPQMEFKNSNAEDLKSVILNEDSKEALGFIKQETSAENIEQEIEKSAPKKYKAIIKKIILLYRSIEKKYIGHLTKS